MADNPQQPASDGQRARTPAQGRAAKANALQRLAILKRSIVISGVVGFGALAALAAQNHVGVTANATNAPSTAQSSTQTATPAAPDNGFFSQGNGDDQGGYGFGQNTVPQQPLTGSSAS